MNYEEFMSATKQQKEELIKNIRENMITIEDIKMTIKVLARYEKVFKGWHEETASILREARTIVEGELERQLDEQSHSEVTIEIEGGMIKYGSEIPLAEWARKNGIDPANARQRAIRGTLKTAHKLGNTWMINEFEEK